MKLYTKNARMGRFFLGRKIQKNIEVIGSTEGFDTFEDAEHQLALSKPAGLKDEILILQVVGEYRIRSTFVEVHPSNEPEAAE